MCGQFWFPSRRQRARRQVTCSRKCGRAKQQRTIDFPESVNWSPPMSWEPWHPLASWEADLDGDELAAALARPLVAMRLVSGGGGGGVGWGCGEGSAPALVGDTRRDVA